MDREYQYPAFVVKATPIGKLNSKANIVVSILETEKNKDMLDIRVFDAEGMRSFCGVMLTYNAAESLLEILKELYEQEYPADKI